MTPPIVSIPKESGVTSSKTTSFTSPCKTPPWTAAPMATASSGLTERLPSFPKSSLTTSWTFGMRLEPPTKRTSSILSAVMPASAKALRQGSFVASNKSSVICSNWARVRFFCKCLGPVASAVMNGRLMAVDVWAESWILAFSAASRRRCKAIGSFERSIPVSFLNSSTSQSIIRRSQSSPPRWVFPFVDFTSKTPSANSKIEMSKVPPPKS